MFLFDFKNQAQDRRQKSRAFNDDDFQLLHHLVKIESARPVTYAQIDKGDGGNNQSKLERTKQRQKHPQPECRAGGGQIWILVAAVTAVFAATHFASPHYRLYNSIRRIVFFGSLRGCGGKRRLYC